MEELPAGRSRDAWGRRWTGPPPVDGKSQVKDCQSEKGQKWPRVRFAVSKLKDLEVRNAFKLALYIRFEGLQQLMENEELPVDDKWRQIEQGYVETCEQVPGMAKEQEGVDQQGDLGYNRAAKGGKKHLKHVQN